MENKKFQWFKIAEAPGELAFSAAGLLQLEVNGKQVCLARVKDEMFACPAKCPHAGGTLAEGFLDALDNIVCPLHRYKFSLQNGRNVSGEGYHLKTYPVKVEPGGIYIGFQKALFNW